MINIHTDALSKLNANEMWLMLHIVKRINADRSAFPSKKTILKDTGWKSEKTLATVMQGLVEKGMIAVQVRLREDGSQTSNLYRVTSNLFGVYVSADKLQEQAVKNTTPRGQKIQGGGVYNLQGGGEQKIQGGSGKKYTPNEVLTNEVLTNEVLTNEVLYNELTDSPAFAGEGMEEVISDFEKEGEPTPTKIPIPLTPPKFRATPPKRPANEMYTLYEIWAKFAEAKHIPVSRTASGNYLFEPKNAAALKLWKTWVEGMPNYSGNLEADWEAFLEAAWTKGGKYIQSNFTPTVLNSKRMEIVIAINYQNTKEDADLLNFVNNLDKNIDISDLL